MNKNNNTRPTDQVIKKQKINNIPTIEASKGSRLYCVQTMSDSDKYGDIELYWVEKSTNKDGFMNTVPEELNDVNSWSVTNGFRMIVYQRVSKTDSLPQINQNMSMRTNPNGQDQNIPRIFWLRLVPHSSITSRKEFGKKLVEVRSRHQTFIQIFNNMQ